jgi:iron complex outermembrane receptor protein|tara:strand:+ start:8400 stop:11309 length:2910 start_codon:yes stop_codon:yes gene_type:complete
MGWGAVALATLLMRGIDIMRPIRPFVYKAALKAAASALLLGAPALAQETSVARFDIEPQPLQNALLSYSEQSRTAIVVPADLVAGKAGNAVAGEMSPGDALELLLQGTGLSPERKSNGALTIAVETVSEEAPRTPAPLQLAQATTSSEPEPVSTQTGTELEGEQDDEAELTMDQMVVTGFRGRPRSVTESPIPIDVFDAEQLESLPQTGLFESLRYLVPSLNLPQRAGGGTATFISSAGLRGLNPDQTLILVNGKRRHKTALINTSTGLFSGSAGVDLNMIPSSAIARIEVLRDGAAAQYGSDAIAGVINIILKDAPEGGSANASYGENFDRNDGEFSNFSINNGFALGENGFANLSFALKDSGWSNRAVAVPLPGEPGGNNLFPLQDDGSFDPRENTIDRMITTNYGNFPQTLYSFGANAGYDFGGVELYSFATYSERESTLDFTYRIPRDSRNNMGIYAFGYRPREVINEDDFDIVAGLLTTALGFDWDFSVGHGFNDTKWENTLGLNASLGLDSPTSFYLGAMNASETTAQFDATRLLDVPMGEMQVSFGAQYREETFEIERGEPASYADGNNGAPPGAQGFPGFAPEAENDVSRDNKNAYVELAWEPTEKLLLAGALRYESFSDSSGEETIGKLNGRYEFSDAFAVRASFNTGFRAPSIQQLGFKGSRGQFADLDNDGVAETIVLRQTLPPTDAAAQALGAEPLTPEKSENISVGFTFTPGYNFTLTVDAYRIDIEDRIALSTQFNRGDGRAAQGGGTIGDEISALLDAAGFDQSLGGANYFTNAIDTRSEGVDVVATWTTDLSFGSLDLSGAYNYNDDSVEKVDENPEELSGLILADGSPVVQFDRSRLGTYTEAIPADKLSLNAALESGPFRFTARATRFGEFTNVATSEANDTENDRKWIADIEAGYVFDNGVEIYAGANNVFNTYPDQVRDPNSYGNGMYDTISPYGFTGGNWYVRAGYKW